MRNAYIFDMTDDMWSDTCDGYTIAVVCCIEY